MKINGRRFAWLVLAGMAFVAIFAAGPVLAAPWNDRIAQADADDQEATPKPADEKPEEPQPANDKADEKKPGAANGLQIQPGEDKLMPLQPVRPRTAETQTKIEALTWYSVGRMHQKRGQNQEALSAFQNALKHDPNSAALLEALIDASLALNRVDDAIEYAQKLVEVDPGHFHALQILGQSYAQQGKIPQAIKMFERAVEAAGIDKNSVIYVRIMRNLGILYRATQDGPKAADAFAVVFDAIENPDRYGLPDSLRRQMMADIMTNFEQLGNAFFLGGKYDLAVKAYNRALETRTGNIGNVIYHLSASHLALDEPDQALAELQKYFDAQRQTQGREAYVLLAKILEAQGKSEELLPKLRELADQDKRNNTLQFYLADRLMQADALEEAEQVLERALERSKDPEGYAVLAGIYHKQNKPNELLRTLAQAYAARNQLTAIDEELSAIAENSELSANVIAEGRKLSEEELDFAHAYVLANLASRADDESTAVEYYRKALEKTRVGEQKYAVYEELADELRSQHKPQEAAEVLQQAVDDPSLVADLNKQVMLYYWLAFNRELAGETDKALEAINAGMQKVGRPVGFLQLREAWIYYHSDQYDEAIKRFEQIAKDFADDKVIVKAAKSNLSNTYVRMGDMRKGEEVLEEIFREQPEDPGINNDLGYLYADQGKNLEQAEKMIRIAIESEPENAAYLDSMGWVLYKRGKFEEALTYLQKAAGKEEGQDGTIYDHLGDVYQRLEKIDKAVEAWQKALELSQSDSKQNKKLIERLEEKLKNHQSPPGQLRPERPDSP